MMVVSLHAMVAGRAVDRPNWPVYVALAAVLLVVEEVALGQQVPVLDAGGPRGNLEELFVSLAPN